MTSDAELARRFEAAAAATRTPNAIGAAAIRGRARRRSQRSVALRVAAAIVLIAGFGGVLQNQLADDTQLITTAVGGPPIEVFEPNGEVPPQEAVAPTWRIVDDPVGIDLDVTWRFDWHQGMFYALGGLDESWVARSADGEVWEKLAPLPDNVSPHILEVIDGELWTVASNDAGWWLTVLRPGEESWELFFLDGIVDGPVVLTGDEELWLITNDLVASDPFVSYAVAEGLIAPDVAAKSTVSDSWTAQGDTTVTIRTGDGEEIEFALSAEEVDDVFELFSEQSTIDVHLVDRSTGTLELVREDYGLITNGVASDGVLRYVSADEGPYGMGGAQLVEVSTTSASVAPLDQTIFGPISLVEGIDETFTFGYNPTGLSLQHLDAAVRGDSTPLPLPYLLDLEGGPSGLVGVGFIYDADPNLVEQGLEILNRLGGADADDESVVAVSTNGTAWTWQTASEVFGDDYASGWLEAAVGEGRVILAVSDAGETKLAVADLG